MSFLYSLNFIVACILGTTALFLTIPTIAQQERPEDWNEELKQIDAEIKSATDLKNRYLAAARRAEDQGLRWQFTQDQKQEAKRAFQRADEKKQAAKMLEARIDALNARKAQILQEHPEANDFQGSP